MTDTWSAFGYGMEPETPGSVRVCLTSYPRGEKESTVTVDMPEAPKIGDAIHFGLDDLPYVTVTHRSWVYEPDIKKWHLECSVD